MHHPRRRRQRDVQKKSYGSVFIICITGQLDLTGKDVSAFIIIEKMEGLWA
jgi:hypothetical protein